MRLATWNVNSVRARLPRLLDWLAETKPDIVCLQETKLSGGACASTRDGAAGSAHPAHTATTALTASAAAPKFILLGCNNDAEVAPSGIRSCGDGAAGLTGVHWTSWTSHLASG